MSAKSFPFRFGRRSAANDPLAAALDNFTMMHRERRKARGGGSIVRQVSERIHDAHAPAHAPARVEDPIVY